MEVMDDIVKEGNIIIIIKKKTLLVRLAQSKTAKISSTQYLSSFAVKFWD
jgi:hypothetical protein